MTGDKHWAKLVQVVMIDLNKTSDSVKQSILCAKLECYGERSYRSLKDT